MLLPPLKEVVFPRSKVISNIITLLQRQQTKTPGKYVYQAQIKPHILWILNPNLTQKLGPHYNSDSNAFSFGLTLVYF